MKVRDKFMRVAKQTALVSRTATELPRDLRQALTARATRFANYTSKGIKLTDSDYQRKAFLADVELLQRQGLMAEDEAKDALTWAKTASKEDLAAKRYHLGREEFMGETLAATRWIPVNRPAVCCQS
jgi:hypothetical protein